MLREISLQDVFSGVISGLVICGFFGIMSLAIFHPIPDNQFSGALTVAFGVVVQYWVGSSRSSQVKDQTIAGLSAMQPTLINATPNIMEPVAK